MGTPPRSSISSPARCPCGAPSPALRRTDFFYGREDTDPDDAAPDIAWLHPDGREFTEPDFHEHGRTLVVRVDGSPSLLLVLHSGSVDIDVLLPDAFGDAAWVPVLDAGTTTGAPASTDPLPAGELLAVPAHTALVLRRGARALTSVPESALSADFATEVAPPPYAGRTTRPSSAGAARRSWRGRTRTV